jgi:hypothetical protein
MTTWAQFSSIPNGTQVLNHGWDQCVAVANKYHEEVVGGSFVPVPSAFMWWTNFSSYATLVNNYFQVAPGDNPQAGDIFISRYGLYNAPHGHIGVVIRGWDGSTFGTLEQNAGTWRYTGRYNRTKQNMLGYLRPRKNPAQVAISSNQRQAGAAPVNRRLDPNTLRPPIDPQLAPGTVGDFDGWIKGENVNGIDIWFRGALSGNWFWAGGFTSQSIDGLSNLNPTTPAVSGNQRIAGILPINRRQEPNTSSAKVDPQIAPGAVVTMAGWAKGESVEGIDTWFKATDGTWAWAGAFTSSGTTNLADLNAKPPTPPTPVPTTAERTVGSLPVRRRQEPKTSATEVQPMLDPGTTHTFQGWIKGESVEGIDVWYKGLTGLYSWAGAFTSQSTEGLKDLSSNTPAPTPTVEADQRILGGTATFRRSAPTRNSAADPVMIDPGATVRIAGWVTGEVIEGIGTWFKIFNTNLYAWAGAFTKPDTFGLEDLNKDTVAPGPVPDTGRASVAERIPNWDESGPATNPTFPRPLAVNTSFLLPTDVKETSSNVSTNGYTVGRPTLPESVGLPPINHFVLHHVAGTSLSGAINTLSGSKGAPTTSYVVQDKNLVSMVPEDCAPWTNGRWKSNLHSITFEMVNAGGSAATGFLPPSADTIETTAQAMARATLRWNIGPLEYGINVFGHKDVSKSATACPGSLDVKAVVARANAILEEYRIGKLPAAGEGEEQEKPETDLTGVAAELAVIRDSIDNIIKLIS